ncbi:MAG: hypothetical protein EOO06_00210 [Chitinophagaceae bacterium]|nr:MAG: hypothetical protein EOO06_00210 [Chitinophagaceae bacterium]
MIQLQIRPHVKNSFPIGALLLRGASPAGWLQELQRMGFALADIKLYPLPGHTANSVWGCLVVTDKPINAALAGPNELCQMVSPQLYIAERTTLYPSLAPTELQKLFTRGLYFIHPEIGWLELTEELDITALIQEPLMRSYHITRPADTLLVPSKIKSFQVVMTSSDDVLQKMEDHIFPKTKPLPDKSLSLTEKLRLQLYRALFARKKDKTGKASGTEKKPLLGWAERIFRPFGNVGTLSEEMQQDYEALEDRNQQAIDRLLELLKNNPELGLQYAIPFDEGGTVRGGQHTEFALLKRWFNLSLSAGQSLGGSGSIDLGNRQYELKQQYEKTAEALVRQGKYEQAAFVYLKLLKNYFKAAETLEAGKRYAEAASIYLKHLRDKRKAAACYEKGSMLSDAIELYKELQEDEKVGDLYMALGRTEEATFYYRKVADQLKASGLYLKASFVYRRKLKDAEEAQRILLQGWLQNKDAYNCLNNYLANLDEAQLKSEIQRIFRQDVKIHNSEPFLHAIRHEYSKNDKLPVWIRDIAYEVIAQHITAKPSLASELRNFNGADKELQKDIWRYSLGEKR